MKKAACALLILPFVFAVLTAADLSGAWTLNLDPDFGGNPDSVECTFKQDGNHLNIQCGSGSPITGEVDGQKVTFQFPTGQHNELTATFVGDLDQSAKMMKGTWHLVDANKKDVMGRFDAKKN